MITGIVRGSYLAIFEPKKNLSGALKYSITLLIPKSDAAGVAVIQDAIDKATAKGKDSIWGGKVPKFRYEPMRDGDKELESGERTGKEWAGHYFINTTSDQPPGVVDRRGKPLLDQTALYSGCYVRADVNAFPYKNSGNCGIGWGLNNLMLWAPGERLDGRQNAEDAFANYAATDDEIGEASDEASTELM